MYNNSDVYEGVYSICITLLSYEYIGDTKVITDEKYDWYNVEKGRELLSWEVYRLGKHGFRVLNFRIKVQRRG